MKRHYPENPAKSKFPAGVERDAGGSIYKLLQRTIKRPEPKPAYNGGRRLGASDVIPTAVARGIKETKLPRLAASLVPDP